MEVQLIALPPHHQALLDRFLAACQDDERIVAAFLGGSYARGAADAYSDLDLGLITADAAYEDFFAERETFLHRLGDLAFLEDFGSETNLFFIFADGTEGELAIGRKSRFTQIHSGPYRTLLDKTGILADAVFPWQEAAETDQVETLRRLVSWFWHDLSHLITALARGQLWWAYGQLGILRLSCVNLARLRANFSAEVQDYDKVDKMLPAEQLAPLQATCCPLEREAMLQAALVIVRFYRETAPLLAQAHGIPYSDALAQVMAARLERLAAAP
jgi:predicted nucleotidyltransferase